MSSTRTRNEDDVETIENILNAIILVVLFNSTCDPQLMNHNLDIYVLNSTLTFRILNEIFFFEYVGTVRNYLKFTAIFLLE